MSQPDFGEKLDAVFDQFGHLCVGIDPHPYLFERWDFDDSPRSLKDFSLRVLDACVGKVGIIKPQVAFYERWGSAGYSALENLIERARQSGLLVIADAKRGDIGSTMQAYAQSWLSPKSHLEADAFTVSPYLGVDSLSATLQLAHAHGKGVFMLAATSNPEARSLQTAIIEQGEPAGSTVARSVLQSAMDSNRALGATSAGVVLGATVRLTDYRIDTDEFAGLPVLAPGFGFQGAEAVDAQQLFGALTKRLIITETRSILESGPEAIGETINRRSGVIAEALR